MLELLEQQIIPQNKQQTYQNKISEEKQTLEEACTTYIDGNEQYFNKQSKNADDGR